MMQKGRTAKSELTLKQADNAHDHKVEVTWHEHKFDGLCRDSDTPVWASSHLVSLLTADGKGASVHTNCVLPWIHRQLPIFYTDESVCRILQARCTLPLFSARLVYLQVRLWSQRKMG